MISLSAAPVSAQGGAYLQAFNHAKDSLLKEVNKHPLPDSARAFALVNILECASFLTEKKQVLPYWEEAIRLGRSLENKKIIAACLEWKGSFYKSARRTDSAQVYLDSAIGEAGNSTDLWLIRVKSFSLFQKALIYENQENFYTALQCYFESLKSYGAADLSKQKMISLRIATIYQNLRNDDKALDYYFNALKLYKQLNTNQPPGRAGEADGIYTYIASIYFDRGDLSRAGFYLDKMSASMPDTLETILTGGYYQLAGQIALKQKKTDSAIFLLKQALKYYGFTRVMHTDQIANVYTDIGGLYLEKEDLPDAKTYLDQARVAAEESGHRETMAAALSTTAKYYYKTGNARAAYEALERATILNDSVMVETNIKQANSLAAIYENGKKEKAIADLQTNQRAQAAAVKQKKLLNTIFITIIAALVVISLIVYFHFSNQQNIRITALEKEKQLMSIEAMLKGQEEERSRLAKDLHDGLGGMLSAVKIAFLTIEEDLALKPGTRATYQKALGQLDKTIDELRKVAHNLMPEALVKFGLKSALMDFCESMQLSCNTRIVCEQYGSERELGNIADVNVYRIIQELVNNALMHGKAKLLVVQMTKTENKVLLTVEDDGVGFTQGKARGMGLLNIRSRIDYFNGAMDIESAPGEGTTVNIELQA